MKNNKKKNNNNLAKILVVSFLAIIIFTFAIDNPVRRLPWGSWGRSLLSLVYQETITPEDLKLSYSDKKFKILLVPGHDDQYFGTQFRDVREADLNLLITSQLYKLLSGDSHFVVVSTRDFETGAYTDVFDNFFRLKKEKILAFSKEKKSIFEGFLKAGDITTNVIVKHNFAPSEVALRLSGINLWSNENEVDLALHVHVNDVGGRKYNRAGDYYGFSIYVPERQYPNSRASVELAQSLSAELQRSIKISNMPKESTGVIEDQELIAIGSYASRDGASILIEYSYIYDPRWLTEADRQKNAKELAQRTYDGLVKYLEPAKVAASD